MRILYYSTAYYSSHGGSNHSRAFVACCVEHQSVEQVKVFPIQNVNAHTKAPNWRKAVKFIPLLQIFFFYRRNQMNLTGLYHEIDLFKPDVLHIRLDSNFLQLKKIKERFPNLLISTEVNASPFDESFSNISFRYYFRNLERHALIGSNYNFFISSNLRDRIMGDRVNPQRDIVVHNGVDTNFFFPVFNKEHLRAKLDIPKNGLVLGYVGTLDPHKRIDNLIKAFEPLAKEREDLFLVIIGDGIELKFLRSLALKFKVENQVLFTGRILHKNIPEYLNCFDIAIHHHANDYMSPLKIFEYLAVGLPVIGPNTPAVREILKEDEHLLLTDGTEINLRSKLYKLIEDKTFASNISKSGMNYIRSNFTWNKQSNLIIRKFKKS